MTEAMDELKLLYKSLLSMATQGSPSAPLCQINGFTGTDDGIVPQLLTSVQATVPRIMQKVTFDRIAC